MPSKPKERVKKALKELKENNKVCKHNLDKALEFIEIKRQGGYNNSTLVHYLTVFHHLLPYLGNKHLEDATQKELIVFFAQMKPQQTIVRAWKGKLITEMRKTKKEFAASTMWAYKCDARAFYRWLGHEDKMQWIERSKNGIGTKVTEKDILRPLEIKAMIEAAGDLRTKALIATLFEVGTRISEHLSLNWDSIKFNGNYAKASIKSAKTNKHRDIYFVKSLPLLRQWLDQHSFPGPGKPLWISFSPRCYGARLDGAGTSRILKKIAKRAGIKKRVYNHLFRHSMITQKLRENYNVEVLKKMVGHAQKSNMIASTYGHLANKDVENAVLKAEGLVEDDKELTKEKKALEIIECPRCGKQWDSTKKVCDCNWFLDSGMAIEFDDRVSKFVTAVMEACEKKPLLRKTIEDAIKER